VRSFRHLFLTTAAIGTLGLAILPGPGSAVARAAELPPSSARSADEEYLVPLLFKVAGGDYYSFDDDLKPSGYLDLTQATRKAAWLHVDRLSTPSSVTFADGMCLSVVAQGTSQRAAKRPCSSAANSRQMWTVGASSLTSTAPIVADAPALSYALPDGVSLGMRGTGAPYTFFAGAVHRWKPLSVTATSVDQKTATAHISGKARPSSTLLVDDDATRRIPVGSDGTWSYDATGLTPGLNRIQFDEYVGTWKSATTQANVTIESSFRPVEITSGHVFPGTPRTTITGMASPFAKVTVFVFGVPESVTALSDGSWSYERGYNNALEYSIDVVQEAEDDTDEIRGWILGPAA
jgi:hypothetical protein